MRMGALTSKPYAFKSRPWELQSRYGNNIFSFFFIPLKFEYRSDQLLRILPNPTAFLCWIPDQIRFNIPIIYAKISSYTHFSVVLRNLLVNFFCPSFKNFNQYITYFSSRLLVFSYFDISSSNYFFESMPIRPRSSDLNFKLYQEHFINKSHLVFFNFNLRLFSPSLIAKLRINFKTLSYCFFGSYFDLALPPETSIFSFSADEFFKIYNTRTSFYSSFFTRLNSIIFQSSNASQLLSSIFFDDRLTSYDKGTFFNLFYFNRVNNSVFNVEKIFYDKTAFSTSSLSFINSNFSVFFSIFPITFKKIKFNVLCYTPSLTNDVTSTFNRNNRYFSDFVFSFFKISYVDAVSYFLNFDYSYNFELTNDNFFLVTPYSILYDSRKLKLKTIFDF